MAGLERFNVNSLRVGGGIAGNTAALRETAFVPVRDNSRFVDQFDATKVIGVFRPKRTLVVGQNPAAGSFIPVGTPVDLTVTVKDALPLDGLKGIDPRVLQRFDKKNVGDLLDTLNRSDAQRVFERSDATDYDALSTADKAAVNTYLSGTFGIDANADAAGAKAVFDNMRFLNDL